MTFIEKVHAKRQKLADVLSDEDYSGIRDIVEELYPDRAHFIYELLQNAEDTGATEASFKLFPDRLTFEHNGHPFTEDNVWGITNIGKGTKSGQEDKIGRFGVGFKAVFVYTETPHIWSPTFSFKISELVLPSAIESRHELGKKTLFEFPFNNSKKSPEQAYNEIKDGLSELAETTLLFLSKLESIRWQIGESIDGEVLRIQHPENHVEVLKQRGLETIASTHFLKFDQPVEGLERQQIAIAFDLDCLPNVQQFDPKNTLAKQLRIIPSEIGRVAVFFPAEKETSGLRFHLHAPFVPELSRASIKETSANQPLFQQLAKLAAYSLHQIRDLGLLNADFLGVLPNPQDSIPPRYQGFRSSIIEEMNQEPLTPTYTKSHAAAKYLLQGKASLKELLSEDDLAVLVDYEHEPPKWSIGATQKNSNVDRFLAGLAITNWDVGDFVELLQETTKEDRWQKPDESFMSWLAGKPVAWHQQWYALLYKELQPEGDLNELDDLRIIRLSNGTYSLGSKCFLPNDGVEHDEVLPRVDAGVYTSGKNKNQQENSRKLLEAIGVREVGESEQVEAILKRRYTKEAEIPNERVYKKDLKRFIALVEKSPDKAGMFTDYWIFERQDGEWGRPIDLFLDTPFLDTCLNAYYNGLGNTTDCIALSEKYQHLGISVERLVNFAKAVGVRIALEIKKTSCYQNPKVSYLVWQAPGRSSSYENNEDYYIDFIEKVIGQKSFDVSLLIWNTISTCKKTWSKARYCKNSHQPYRVAPSRLAAILAENEWVPQGDNAFVRPKEASSTLLPKGFPFDKGWEWLRDIGFGEQETIKEIERERNTEAARQRESMIKELGFSDEASFRRAQRFAALLPEEQERVLSDLEQRKTIELPEHEPSNPGRRAARVSDQADEAPERHIEERTRSISVGVEAVKQEAAQYLRQQYTNNDGEMICQICKGSLPFKLDDGSDYFEKVELFFNLKKRHYQNYLALCPNHAAMFRHTNGSADLMQEMFVDLTGNELEVVLAQKNASIYFTKTHIADLKSVIFTDCESVEADVGEA